jgi:cytochrome c553
MITSSFRFMPLVLCFAAIARAAPTVYLPIEVMSSTTLARTVSVDIPNPITPGAVSLYLQIHGLEYQTQASVQVNGGPLIPINSSNITITGLGQNYGGIGGGFHTLTMTVALPQNLVVQGTNTITFQFNGTDGISSGYRVLDLDLWDVNGNPLIDRSVLVQANPNNWEPPLNDPTDIAAGQTLWQTASLSQPVPGSSPTPLVAHCMDCHAQDGRDLKYFNYSNKSIVVRSMFHGLSEDQGRQIASFIRSLPYPNPGMPWNPPYQPGPGLDSAPVQNWSAGAGLSGVLSSDQDMQSYVSPTGMPADFNPAVDKNARQTPIAFQLNDWNHWLPQVYPADAFGDSFTSSAAYTTYLSLRANLVPNDPTVYSTQQYTLTGWEPQREAFQMGVIPATGDPSWSNPYTARSIYSIGLWQNVKMWEINQDFGLEAMAPAVMGPTPDPRAWDTNAVFQSSPSIMKIPPGSPGIGNGSVTTFDYHSFAWYYTQLILNDGSHQIQCTNPVDWGYLLGFEGSMATASSPQAMLQLFLLSKVLSESDNGVSPAVGCLLGWNPNNNNQSRLFVAENSLIYSQITPTVRNQLVNNYLTEWYAAVRAFTPQDYYSGSFASPNDIETPGYGDGNWISQMAYSIPRMKYWGVNSTLTNNIVSFCEGIWPNFNWSTATEATCTTDAQSVVHCTNDN